MVDVRAVKVHAEADRWIIQGELDASTVNEVERCIATGVMHRMVDLSEVTFVDSCGLRLLVALSHEAARNGQRVVFLSPTAQLLKLVKLTGLGEVIRFQKDGQVVPELRTSRTSPDASIDYI